MNATILIDKNNNQSLPKLGIICVNGNLDDFNLGMEYFYNNAIANL